MSTPLDRRLSQLLLLSSTLAASWLAMMVVHESGHILHALLSGGRVARIILNPLAFSRTDLSHNPHPAFVAWGGVIWGSILPVAAWIIARAAHVRFAFLLRFFAGFCLIANGAYLATGVLIPTGDTDDLIHLGVSRWLLPCVGLPMFAAGLALWNGLGPSFGFRGQAVDRTGVIATAAVFLVLLAGMLLWPVVQ